MRNYDIFVAKIYDYAAIDSFRGFPRFIDSPTSYATLPLTKLSRQFRLYTVQIENPSSIKEAHKNMTRIYDWLAKVLIKFF